jgi:hypothetical protein
MARTIPLETELRRLAVRWDLPQAEVTDVLHLFDIFTPDRALFSEAGLLPGRHSRSLDALHAAWMPSIWQWRCGWAPK